MSRHHPPARPSPRGSASRKDCVGEVTQPPRFARLPGTGRRRLPRTMTDPDRGLFPKPDEDSNSSAPAPTPPICANTSPPSSMASAFETRHKPGPLLHPPQRRPRSELLSGTAQETLHGTQGTDAALAGESLSALFGIALAEDPGPAKQKPKKKTRSPRPAGRGNVQEKERLTRAGRARRLSIVALQQSAKGQILVQFRPMDSERRELDVIELFRRSYPQARIGRDGKRTSRPPSMTTTISPLE